MGFPEKTARPERDPRGFHHLVGKWARKKGLRKETVLKEHPLRALCPSPASVARSPISRGPRCPTVALDPGQNERTQSFQDYVHDEFPTSLLATEIFFFYYQILSCVLDGSYSWKCDFREYRLTWKSPPRNRIIVFPKNFQQNTPVLCKSIFPTDCQGKGTVFSRPIKSLESVTNVCSSCAYIHHHDIGKY